MKQRNWIGWLKTLFILICCSTTLISLVIAESPVTFREEMSFYWFIIFGVTCVFFNVFTDRIFRKNIIEHPKWNDDPFNLKYPMRIFQFFGICAITTGGMACLLYAIKFSNFSAPYNSVFGIGLGILIGVRLLLRFRKKEPSSLT